MDKIDKSLLKIPLGTRKKILAVLEKVANNELSELDLRKLSNRSNVYRVRVGRYRVIIRRVGDRLIVQKIAKRDSNTYK